MSTPVKPIVSALARWFQACQTLRIRENELGGLYGYRNNKETVLGEAIRNWIDAKEEKELAEIELKSFSL